MSTMTPSSLVTLAACSRLRNSRGSVNLSCKITEKGVNIDVKNDYKKTK